jgi:hypothetical protein
MTQIGAIKCLDGIVLFADRQETIPDYAKWDVGKIYLWELQDHFRFAMTGAGDSDIIEMVWEQVTDECKNKQLSEIKETIVRKIHSITKTSILPMPMRERPYVDLIWVIQPISSQAISEMMRGPELFRTTRFAVNGIDRHYFSGSAALLNRFLADQFLENTIIGLDEAEALATYVLWESSQYDPNVGKHSDVFTFKRDGKIGRLSVSDIEYWERHWRLFKESLRLLPILSCATGVTEQIYKREDHLHRLRTTVETLNTEQKKMREEHKIARSELEEKLFQNLREVAMKYIAKP